MRLYEAKAAELSRKGQDALFIFGGTGFILVKINMQQCQSHFTF